MSGSAHLSKKHRIIKIEEAIVDILQRGAVIPRWPRYSLIGTLVNEWRWDDCPPTEGQIIAVLNYLVKRGHVVCEKYPYDDLYSLVMVLME